MSKIIYKDPNRFYVYAFLREDNTPYYIGKGQGTRAWSKSRRISPPTDSSRISILKGTLTETEAFSEEIRLIAFYGRKDDGTGILRNLTDGGDGTSGHKPSTEHRAKQSAAITGKKASQETRAKQSAAKTGKKHTPETLANMSAAQTGEHNPMFGKCHTQEAKDKMSESHTGKKHTQDTLDKMSAARTGKKHSPETIAKRTATRARNREARKNSTTICEENNKS